MLLVQEEEEERSSGSNSSSTASGVNQTLSFSYWSVCVNCKFNSASFKK